jgi:PhoH-like ATPase
MVKKATDPKKAYVLDTNVLVHDPNALFSFKGVLVGIPSVVLEELDSFKREGTDRGRNSRHAVRLLDGLRSGGSLKDGVTLENGTVVRVLFMPIVDKNHTFPFPLTSNDNAILYMAVALKGEGYHVKFISKDINARIKSDALGLEAEDYLEEHVSKDEFYHGWRSVPVPSIELKADEPGILQDLIKRERLTMNEFVLLESQNNPNNNRVFRYVGGKKFMPIGVPNLQWPLGPRNAQQQMALNLLMDNTVQFVTLFGPAGTGKTFLALLAGLHKVLTDHTFEKMLISRPVVPLGRDIGYLPGDVKEKLHSWMLPIYDNMDFIVHSTASRNQQEGGEDQEPEFVKGKNNKHKEKHKHNQNGAKRSRSLMPLDELIYRGKISLEAITYMRGRSIPYQYILIDEAQNLTPHEVKTIVSRVGEGSKIILCGDPYQIDVPYLDFSSNGLVTASEKFKGQNLFGSVYLSVSERSSLSQLVNQLL